MISLRPKIVFDMGYRVVNNQIISPKGKIRKTFLNEKQHYPTFGVKISGKVFTIKCHHLSAWQKFGKDCIGAEIEIRHINDDPNVFDPTNIELGTKEDNVDDRYINSLLQQWIEETNQEAKEKHEKEISIK